MKTYTEPTYRATVYIAGLPAEIERACAAFALSGLCVTITPTTFVYTYGREAGAAIGLVNYPRFGKEFYGWAGMTDYHNDWTPTHWRHLPKPPVSAK